MSLAGKDYFTVQEAADYAGVSMSQWKKSIKGYNIRSFKFMGKTLFRKSDLVRELETAWQQSRGAVNAAKQPASTGPKAASGIALASARSRLNKQKRSEWKKNSSFAQAQAKS